MHRKQSIFLVSSFIAAEFMLSDSWFQIPDSCSQLHYSCHFSFIGIPDLSLLTLYFTQVAEFSQPALFLERVLPYCSRWHTAGKMVLYSDSYFCFVILHVCNTAFFTRTHHEQWRVGGCGTMSVLNQYTYVQLYHTACFCRKVGKSRDALKLVYFFFLSYFFLSLFSKILAKTCQNAKLYLIFLAWATGGCLFFLRISPQIQAK